MLKRSTKTIQSTSNKMENELNEAVDQMKSFIEIEIMKMEYYESIYERMQMRIFVNNEKRLRVVMDARKSINFWPPRVALPTIIHLLPVEGNSPRK